MNHVYRLVWNAALNKPVAVAERARGRGKSGGRSRRTRMLLASVLLAGGASGVMGAASGAAPNLHPVAASPVPLLRGGSPAALDSPGAATAASALPSGYQIATGVATVSTQGATMTVLQGSQQASINWQNFSIGGNAVVDFLQPSTSAVILNRVVGSEASVISGALNANGHVFLLNSNGVLFTKGAQVNVGGLVASTLGISDSDFLAGRNTFTANGGRASVINEGHITAADGGYVALMGNIVDNQGVIGARLGTVAMAAGDRISLKFGGSTLVGVTIDQGTLHALVENQQAIVADGGQVILTANGLDTVLGSQVNNTGEIRAQTVANQSGRILLLGGMASGTVNVGGTIDASAPDGGNGGFVETSAAQVKVSDTARVLTAAALGLTGSWLLDPVDFTIAASGGDITGTALSAALASGSVTIQTTSGGIACAGASCGAGSGSNGDIFVNAPVTWSTNNRLTLSAFRDININQPITATGSTGAVALYYGQGALNNGNTATYSFGLTSAGFAGQINLQAGSNFSTKLGSDGTVLTYTVITSLGSAADASSAPATLTLQGLAAAPMNGNYVLGANIVDSTPSMGTWNGGAGFTPIGANAGAAFSGIFDGLGHTITGLALNKSTIDSGLFGVTTDGSLIQNVGLVNVNVTGAANVGGLVGYHYGSGMPGSIPGVINSTYVTGTVSSAGPHTGGLVGLNGGSINHSFATVTVSGSSYVGGLVGANQGGGSINNSYATANVTASGNYGGGLVGQNYGNISASHSSGSVGSAQYAGGLVGQNGGGATISGSHSSASVSGSTYGLGGLVGTNFGGISTSYATGNITGTGTGVGGLVGTNVNGTVTDSYASGAIIASGAANNVGGLVGNNNAGSGSILRCYATGNITAVSTSATAPVYIGGLAGQNQASISSSFATGSISVSITTNTAYVGGLVGSASGGSETNSYALGHVSASASTGGAVFAGGLVGYQYGGTVTNSYAAGTLAGNGTMGGLIGKNDTTATLINSFYDHGVNPTLTGVGVTYTGTTPGTTTPADVAGQVMGMTTADMKLQASFTTAAASNGNTNPAWDFTTPVWQIIPTANGGYACLAWSASCVNTTPIYLDVRAGSSVYGSGPSFTYGYFTTAVYGVGTSISNAAPAGTPVWSGAPTAASGAGSYTVTPNIAGITLGSNLYTLQAGNSVVWSVTPLPVSITTLGGASRTYDGTANAAAGLLTVTNLVNGDTLNLSGTAALASGAVGLEPLVGLTGLVLGNPNYTLTGATWSGAVQITAAASTGSAAASAGDPVGNIVASAIMAGDAVASPPDAVGAADESNAVGPRGTDSSALTQVPATVSSAFGPGAELKFVSSPSADEPTQVVSLSAAQAMLGGAGGNSDSGPGGSGDPARTPDVRVPVSLNSLAEIVNGGVRLPSGVEQQLFVVAAH